MENLVDIDLTLLEDPEDYLKHSNFKYNQKGQMSFIDKVYLTEWTTKDNKFQSESHFNSIDGEMFSFGNMDLFDDENWNVFGFEQTMRDESMNLNFSPYHQNKHFELYYLEEGNFTIKLQKDIITLKAGDILIINRLINHSDVFDFNPSHLYILGLNDEVFDIPFLKTLEESVLKDFILRHMSEDLSKSEWMMMNVKDLKPAIDRSLERIYYEMKERQLSYEELLDVILIRMFKLMNTMEVTKEHSEKANSRNLLLFDEIQRYMKVHHATLTLDDLAGHLKFSKEYISRLIKEVSGMGYSQFLQDIRIEQAKRLLNLTELSVQDISIEVGYQNLSHFYSIFKTQTGLTPNNYRKLTE